MLILRQNPGFDLHRFKVDASRKGAVDLRRRRLKERLDIASFPWGMISISSADLTKCLRRLEFLVKSPSPFKSTEE